MTVEAIIVVENFFKNQRVTKIRLLRAIPRLKAGALRPSLLHGEFLNVKSSPSERAFDCRMESVGLLKAHRWNDCIKSSRPEGRGNAHELLSMIPLSDLLPMTGTFP